MPNRPAPRDTEYTDEILTSVREEPEGWVITSNQGSLYIPRYDRTPQVGQKARYYGAGFGAVVRGVVISNTVVYYRTVTEQQLENKRWLDNYHRQQREAFEKNRSALDASFAALPKVFQDRIAKFRLKYPGFRRTSESYEMFCCEQAVLIANALGTRAAILEFRNLDWDKQKQVVPGLDEGHSGNTFGCACALAALYVEDPSFIPQLPQALAPLTGTTKSTPSLEGPTSEAATDSEP